VSARSASLRVRPWTSQGIAVGRCAGVVGGAGTDPSSPPSPFFGR
jgi:hypothetical protein